MIIVLRTLEIADEFALLAIGYDKRHPVINRAIQGLTSLLCSKNGQIFLWTIRQPL